MFLACGDYEWLSICVYMESGTYGVDEEAGENCIPFTCLWFIFIRVLGTIYFLKVTYTCF